MENSLLDVIKQVHINLEKSVSVIETRIRVMKPYLEQLDVHDLILFREWLKERQREYLLKNGAKLGREQLEYLLDVFKKEYDSTFGLHVEVNTKALPHASFVGDSISISSECKSEIYKSHWPSREDKMAAYWKSYGGENRYLVGIDPYNQNPVVKPFNTPYEPFHTQEDIEKILTKIVVYKKPKSKKRRKLLLL